MADDQVERCRIGGVRRWINNNIANPSQTVSPGTSGAGVVAFVRNERFGYAVTEPGAPWTGYQPDDASFPNSRGFAWLVTDNTEPVTATWEAEEDFYLTSSLILYPVAIPPTVDSVSPVAGYVGTPVTITGSAFTGATGVAFGRRPPSFPWCPTA